MDLNGELGRINRRRAGQPYRRPGMLTPVMLKLGQGLAYQQAVEVAAGKHVLLVDLNTGFPQNAFADIAHPNNAGYAWMAGIWYDAIKNLLAPL